MLNDKPFMTHNQRVVACMVENRNEQTHEHTDADDAAMDPQESLRVCVQEAIRDAYARCGLLETMGLHAGAESQSLRSRITRWETALRRKAPQPDGGTSMHNALNPVSLPVELPSAEATPMKWNVDTISALAKRMVRADWWYGYSEDSAVRMAGATKVRAIYKDIGDLAQSDMDAAHELWAKHAPAEFAKPAALDEQAQHLDLLAAEVISEPEPEPEPEDPSAPWIECRRFHTVAGKDPATRSWLDRFETVVEIHALVAYAQVRMHIHGFHDEAAAHGLFEAHKFVVDLARFDAENDESTEPPLQYPDLLDDYRTAHADRCIDLLEDMDDSTIPEGHTLYCPRGCNQLSTTAARDECGVCGQTMLPENEDQYYGSLIAAGQCL